VLLTYTDITLRKHAQTALLQAQRIESLGTLAAGIAHDFNNILLAISGNASLANSELPAHHPARESLGEVLRASLRASDLVKRILLFARADDTRRQVGQLRAVVEEALKLLKPTLPARIELNTQLAPDVAAVSMDASQMHQVIVNLVTNAAYAIDEAGDGRVGRIALELREVELKTAQRVGDRDLAAGRYVCLAISDNGCGMEAAISLRIFDPFFTTKPVGRGTGLGLPIVHGIVHDHGGAIAVSSEPGRGTRFEVYLPAVPAQASAAPDDSPVPTQSGQGQHVLYLDDEDALVFLVTRYLRRLGYRVTGYSDPAEAVREFTAHPEQFDVVVTDLSMPGMSGFDVVKAMRYQRPGVPVIMMSGFVRPEDRERAAVLGVNQLLFKPSTVDELGQAIDRELH
jgi:nitrogen-specific signal transduction histidine kinase/CheY-like chemotaxis protein